MKDEYIKFHKERKQLHQDYLKGRVFKFYQRALKNSDHILFRIGMMISDMFGICWIIVRDYGYYKKYPRAEKFLFLDGHKYAVHTMGEEIIYTRLFDILFKTDFIPSVIFGSMLLLINKIKN